MKTIEELESTAYRYWPPELAQEVARINPIPLLLETQDSFLSILKISDSSPYAFLEALKCSTLPPNLFLKHLSVLTDIGGERLQRFAKDFHLIFPKNKMRFSFNKQEYEYTFSHGAKNWSNISLNLDKSRLSNCYPMTDGMKDVSVLLLWGSSIIDNSNLPEELVSKCQIGELIGKPALLESFVRQRYICVSKITGGSTANDSGHICEQSIIDRLNDHLPSHIKIGGHNVPGISQNDTNLTTFDIVITNELTQKCCAIEVSFQVTTNSVIERKSSLAQNRQGLLHEKGHKVAYVIDGSGNFQRKNAILTILRFSDCCVNFSDAGIKELASFVVNNL